MSITFGKGGTSCVVRLEGDIDITCAAELKTVLIEAIASGKTLQLDLTGATDLDVNAVQLLWATVRAADKAGTSMTLAGEIPENIRRALDEAGFGKLVFTEAGKALPGSSAAAKIGNLE